MNEKVQKSSYQETIQFRQDKSRIHTHTQTCKNKKVPKIVAESKWEKLINKSF